MNYVSDPLKRLARQPAFVICVLVVGFCAATLQVGAKALRVNFRKEAVPLRKAFSQMDENKLGPYKVVQRAQIPEEIEAELGTKEYLQWVLEDTSVETKDPRRFLSLFVTYYTGHPDKVPHVPDECYRGSGGQIIGSNNLTITVPNNGTNSDEIQMRVLQIQMSQRGMGLGSEVRTVGYFFSVNGDYLCTRTEVRTRLGRLFDKYAYFSKVEMNILEPRDMSPKEIITTLEKLAQHIVPVLAQDHWPDWKALTAEQQ